MAKPYQNRPSVGKPVGPEKLFPCEGRRRPAMRGMAAKPSGPSLLLRQEGK